MSISQKDQYQTDQSQELKLCTLSVTLVHDHFYSFSILTLLPPFDNNYIAGHDVLLPPFMCSEYDKLLEISLRDISISSAGAPGEIAAALSSESPPHSRSGGMFGPH